MEAEEEEEPWREFGMNEAGNAAGDSAQAHDSVSEAVQGLVDTFISIGVQCPSWVFLYTIAVLPHFWPNFIKPGCSLNRCQSFSCSYMSVQNCRARESNPESRWWSFTIDFPTVLCFLFV